MPRARRHTSSGLSCNSPGCGSLIAAWARRTQRSHARISRIRSVPVRGSPGGSGVGSFCPGTRIVFGPASGGGSLAASCATSAVLDAGGIPIGAVTSAARSAKVRSRCAPESTPPLPAEAQDANTKTRAVAAKVRKAMPKALKNAQPKGQPPRSLLFLQHDGQSVANISATQTGTSCVAKPYRAA